MSSQLRSRQSAAVPSAPSSQQKKGLSNLVSNRKLSALPSRQRVSAAIAMVRAQQHAPDSETAGSLEARANRRKKIHSPRLSYDRDGTLRIADAATANANAQRTELQPSLSSRDHPSGDRRTTDLSDRRHLVGASRLGPDSGLVGAADRSPADDRLPSVPASLLQSSVPEHADSDLRSSSPGAPHRSPVSTRALQSDSTDTFRDGPSDETSTCTSTPESQPTLDASPRGTPHVALNRSAPSARRHRLPSASDTTETASAATPSDARTDDTVAVAKRPDNRSFIQSIFASRSCPPPPDDPTALLPSVPSVHDDCAQGPTPKWGTNVSRNHFHFDQPENSENTVSTTSATRNSRSVVAATPATERSSTPNESLSIPAAPSFGDAVIDTRLTSQSDHTDDVDFDPVLNVRGGSLSAGEESGTESDIDEDVDIDIDPSTLAGIAAYIDAVSKSEDTDNRNHTSTHHIAHTTSNRSVGTAYSHPHAVASHGDTDSHPGSLYAVGTASSSCSNRTNDGQSRVSEDAPEFGDRTRTDRYNDDTVPIYDKLKMAETNGGSGGVFDPPGSQYANTLNEKKLDPPTPTSMPSTGPSSVAESPQLPTDKSSVSSDPTEPSGSSPATTSRASVVQSPTAETQEQTIAETESASEAKVLSSADDDESRPSSPLAVSSTDRPTDEATSPCVTNSTASSEPASEKVEEQSGPIRHVRDSLVCNDAHGVVALSVSHASLAQHDSLVEDTKTLAQDSVEGQSHHVPSDHTTVSGDVPGAAIDMIVDGPSHQVFTEATPNDDGLLRVQNTTLLSHSVATPKVNNVAPCSPAPNTSSLSVDGRTKHEQMPAEDRVVNSPADANAVVGVKSLSDAQSDKPCADLASGHFPDDVAPDDSHTEPCVTSAQSLPTRGVETSSSLADSSSAANAPVVPVGDDEVGKLTIGLPNPPHSSSDMPQKNSIIAHGEPSNSASTIERSSPDVLRTGASQPVTCVDDELEPARLSSDEQSTDVCPSIKSSPSVVSAGDQCGGDYLSRDDGSEGDQIGFLDQLLLDDDMIDSVASPTASSAVLRSKKEDDGHSAGHLIRGNAHSRVDVATDMQHSSAGRPDAFSQSTSAHPTKLSERYHTDEKKEEIEASFSARQTVDMTQFDPLAVFSERTSDPTPRENFPTQGATKELRPDATVALFGTAHELTVETGCIESPGVGVDEQSLGCDGALLNDSGNADSARKDLQAPRKDLPPSPNLSRTNDHTGPSVHTSIILTAATDEVEVTGSVVNEPFGRHLRATLQQCDSQGAEVVSGPCPADVNEPSVPSRPQSKDSDYPAGSSAVVEDRYTAYPSSDTNSMSVSATASPHSTAGVGHLSISGQRSGLLAKNAPFAVDGIRKEIGNPSSADANGTSPRVQDELVAEFIQGTDAPGADELELRLPSPRDDISAFEVRLDESRAFVEASSRETSLQAGATGGCDASTSSANVFFSEFESLVEARDAVVDTPEMSSASKPVTVGSNQCASGEEHAGGTKAEVPTGFAPVDENVFASAAEIGQYFIALEVSAESSEEESRRLRQFQNLVRPVLNGEKPTIIEAAQIRQSAAKASVSLSLVDKFLDYVDDQQPPNILQMPSPQDADDFDQVVEQSSLTSDVKNIDEDEAIVGFLNRFNELKKGGHFESAPTHGLGPNSGDAAPPVTHVASATEEVEIDATVGFVKLENAPREEEPWWEDASPPPFGHLHRNVSDSDDDEAVGARAVGGALGAPAVDLSTGFKSAAAASCTDHPKICKSGSASDSSTDGPEWCSKHTRDAGDKSLVEFASFAFRQMYAEESRLWSRKNSMALYGTAWDKHRRWVQSGTFGVQSPPPIDGVAAAGKIERFKFRRSLLPVLRPWQVSYKERTKEHDGYFDVDVYSIYETSAVCYDEDDDEDCEMDYMPWENRQVKQRFLHEKSISFSRNWFGMLPLAGGNDRVRQPVCRPKSMEMPIENIPDPGEWTEEWYTTWKSPGDRDTLTNSLGKGRYGHEDEVFDGDYTHEYSSSYRRTRHNNGGFDDEDGTTWTTTEGGDGGSTRNEAKSRVSSRAGHTSAEDDGDSDGESWEEAPECGVIINVKQKIGERISRVHPDLTSSLRRSRWRRKYFPQGTFPYR